MKVTFCILDWPNYVGGPNTWLKRLAPMLVAAGIEVRVLAICDSKTPETCPTVVAFREQGIDCPATSRPTYIDHQIRWILTRLRENPPDVFVPHTLVAAHYAGRWVREAGIPTLSVIHSDDATWRAILDQFVFGDPAYRLSAVVAVSSFLEQQILDRNPGDVLVHRIPCGVPVPQNMARMPASRMRVIYTGRLVEKQKRVSELTRALCRAVREVPNTEAVIYGDGPSTVDVKQIIATEGVGLPVRLAGRVESDQIQEHLLASHVLVLLSDYEGLPASLMEAMAAGVVVVCLRMRSGVPELIEHDETGLLVEDRGDDFVRAVRRLRDEPETWQRLSLAARGRIEAEYSDVSGAASWVKLLRELSETFQQKRTIHVPRRISLPPIPPELAQGHMKRPLLPVLFFRGGWRWAGRISRRVIVSN